MSINDLNTATVTNRSSLLSGASNYLDTSKSKLIDIQIGKLHILNMSLHIKANVNTGGYTTIAVLPYQIKDSAAFTVSAWQIGTSFMGSVNSPGDMQVAGHSTYGAVLEHRAQVIVYEN